MDKFVLIIGIIFLFTAIIVSAEPIGGYICNEKNKECFYGTIGDERGFFEKPGCIIYEISNFTNPASFCCPNCGCDNEPRKISAKKVIEKAGYKYVDYTEIQKRFELKKDYNFCKDEVPNKIKLK